MSGGLIKYLQVMDLVQHVPKLSVQLPCAVAAVVETPGLFSATLEGKLIVRQALLYVCGQPLPLHSHQEAHLIHSKASHQNITGAPCVPRQLHLVERTKTGNSTNPGSFINLENEGALWEYSKLSMAVFDEVLCGGYLLHIVPNSRLHSRTALNKHTAL